MGNDLLMTNEIIFGDDETTKEIFFTATMEENVVKERVIRLTSIRFHFQREKNLGGRVLSETAVKRENSAFFIESSNLAKPKSGSYLHAAKPSF